MKYIKQLDSVRAIAVIFVIISHWFPFRFIEMLQLGSIGVDIFFVLSGFLITRILLDAKESGARKSNVMKNFYARRILRIFPVYYVTISLLLLFHYYTGSHIQEAFAWFLSYTQNYYFYHIQSWDGPVSHLWSLAVEEQFYLIWPWVVVFINRKYTIHAIVLFILTGVFSHIIMRYHFLGDILTPACFDSFGMGALLAWFINYKSNSMPRFFSWLKVLAGISFAVYVESRYLGNWIPLRTLISVMALWLITYIMMNYNSNQLKFKFVLNNPSFIYIGKISYGIYLFHRLVGTVLNSAFIDKYLNPLLPDFIYKKFWGELYLLENVILLMLISWLSYTFLEQPFLRLKKFFRFDKQKLLNVSMSQRTDVIATPVEGDF